MNNEFLHITSAEYVSGYLLKLTFSNGDVRLFDFSRLYNKGVFVKLKNPEYSRTIPSTVGLSIGTMNSDLLRNTSMNTACL